VTRFCPHSDPSRQLGAKIPDRSQRLSPFMASRFFPRKYLRPPDSLPIAGFLRRSFLSGAKPSANTPAESFFFPTRRIRNCARRPLSGVPREPVPLGNPRCMETFPCRVSQGPRIFAVPVLFCLTETKGPDQEVFPSLNDDSLSSSAGVAICLLKDNRNGFVGSQAAFRAAPVVARASRKKRARLLSG